jgi:serine acetyltransferase/GT2 family glycosyltransferase
MSTARPLAPVSPQLSVVVATYNRLPLLTRLLWQLATQTLPPEQFEVVVVDDGSREPVRPALEGLPLPYTLRVEVQQNAGAAAARHRGVVSARGTVVLITDDDMQVAPDFLARHLARHPEGSRNVVLGRIRSDPSIQDMPLFERWYAYLNDRMAVELTSSGLRARGSDLFTGNVSFRRADYLAVGGFDASLRQAEDVELGLRLEKSGCRFEFAPDAHVLHGSDHVSFEKWRQRARRYGVFYSRVARKHPDAPQVNPWRFLFEMSPLARPLLASAVALPTATERLTSAVLEASRRADALGLEKAAFAGMSVAFGMDYLRGAREEAGSWPALANEVWRYAVAPRGDGDVKGDKGLLGTLWEDAVELARAADGETSAKAMAKAVLTSDAYRIMALNRVREAARRKRVPLVNHALRVAQTAVMGVEIGKDVTLGRGVYFVHSLGTVIGGDAKVGDRVRFYGNNTVGTAKDNGYPVIEDDVQVGAGARILGPVRIGARSRIGANAVVLEDVPPDSVVVGIPARVVSRKKGEGE